MIMRLITVIVALCLASAAEAQWFSTPGTGCVPSDTTIGRYKASVAFVRHAIGNVDLISFTCPMSTRFNVGSTCWELKLTYQDSTGTSPAAYVRARLYQMVHDSATPVLLAQVSSNSSASTTVNTVISPTLTHIFDFGANIYWIRVDIDRTSASESAFFHAVYLDDKPC